MTIKNEYKAAIQNMSEKLSSAPSENEKQRTRSTLKANNQTVGKKKTKG